MKENLQKFGEVAVFGVIAVLFFITGYVSWGHGSPEMAGWFMPAVTVASLGWGIRLLHASLVETHRLRSSNNPQEPLISR